MVTLGKIDSAGIEPYISASSVLGSGEPFSLNSDRNAEANEMVERFLRYNDNQSGITIEIHPDYIECSYSLTYHNNVTGEHTYRVDK